MTDQKIEECSDSGSPADVYSAPEVTFIGRIDELTLGTGTTVVDSPAGSGV